MNLRIAYLISAYRDAPHLRRLVDALGNDADYFVHIDRNADFRPFEQALAGRVTFVPRHRVTWGGWGQVLYQRELLGAALHCGKHYDRIVCLSGQDYPLWSAQKIATFFAAHPDTEFIAGYNLAHTTVRRQRDKVVCYHLFRDVPAIGTWWRNKLVVASRTLLRLLPFRKPPTVQIGTTVADVYFGSDYWALTGACARYVWHTLCTEPHLERYFRTCFAPSELCIQTIVFNSPFAARAQRFGDPYPGLARLTPLHYIDYGKAIHIMTLADLPLLRASGKMFCRKVVTGPSDTLVDALPLND